MIKELFRKIRTHISADIPLTSQAKRQLVQDRAGLPKIDPGAELIVSVSTQWLCRAQDHSLHHDGGVARDFSLIKGWASSYPETTGYIVPTVLDVARRTQSQELRQRARHMLDWLVSIQFPEGGFQGGKIDAQPRVPVTFNTGQILLGLAAGVVEFGDEYRPALISAATWLRDSLDPDGCWRRYPTPFAEPGEKAYETHVAWGLFEADRVHPGSGFGAAGLRQVRWALTKQQVNGWFADCCLSFPTKPLTHTIGYVLRGVIEGYRHTPDKDLLAAAILTADALLDVIEADGRIAGRLDAHWKPAVDWVCLTGAVQIAACWFLLYEVTGNKKYLEAARRANGYVRRTVPLEGDPDTVGGLRGAFPVDGHYGRFEYLNWATKFMIDANLMELDINKRMAFAGGIHG